MTAAASIQEPMGAGLAGIRTAMAATDERIPAAALRALGAAVVPGP